MRYVVFYLKEEKKTLCSFFFLKGKARDV